MQQKPDVNLVVRALIDSIKQNPPKKSRRESTIPNKKWRDGKCRVMRGISLDRCKWCMTCPWIQPDGETNMELLKYCIEHPGELAIHMMRKIYPGFGV